MEKKGKPDFNLLHRNSNFPYKDYIVPPSKQDKKEYRMSSSNIEDSTIRETEENIKMKKQKIPKKKPKQNHEKTTGHNIRKAHMALHYKQAKVAEHIKSKVINLKPTNIPEDISSVFLSKIWETMNNDIQKDIKELYKAYKHQLWTSATLMAYRTLENILKVHITSDLKKDPGNSIASAIKVLEDEKYNLYLLKQLSKYKEERNEYMHGNKRAGANDAKKIVADIISITIHIHNIKP